MTKQGDSVIRRVLAAAAVLAVGGIALAAPAQATDAAVCGKWTARGAAGAYPDITFGGKPAGTEVGKFIAKLTKPAVGVAPGVEFARKGINVEVEESTTVTVDYALGAGASFAAGAIRIFGYQSADPDTINDGPDWSDVATSAAGTLSFTVPAGSTIGTLGLVYDASNSAEGSVVFTGLTIGDRKVSFRDCPKPEPTPSESSASPSPSVSASPSASATATASTSASATSQPTTATPTPSATTDVPLRPVGGNAGGGGLPVTGTPVAFAAAGGLVLLLLGGAALVVVRRRRTRFTA